MAIAMLVCEQRMILLFSLSLAGWLERIGLEALNMGQWHGRRGSGGYDWCRSLFNGAYTPTALVAFCNTLVHE